MEIKEMNFEELETRRAELAEEIKDATEERLDAINAELDAIEARKAEIKAEAEERAKAIEEVINAPAPTPIIEERKNDKMDRNSKEYINAFAEYLKTGDDTECRALLTENVSGGKVAVPELVEERIKTAWANDEIMNRVTKLYVRGNLKVGYEVSSSEAVAHTEGAAAVTEEALVLGVVNLVPVMLKKWISVSDEAMALRGQAFIDYIFDELEYRIVKLAADTVVNKIKTASAPMKATGTADELTAFVTGFALLSDEATDVCAIMKRATYAAIKSAAIGANYAVDPFEGRPVLFNEAVVADTIIVGDLKGVTANFPEGDEVKINIDDKTLMTQDLVRILGKLYVAIEVTAPGRFAVITIQ